MENYNAPAEKIEKNTDYFFENSDRRGILNS